MLSYLTLFLLVFDVAIPPVKAIGSAPFSALISLVILFTNRERRCECYQIITTFKSVIVLYYLGFLIVLARLFFSGAYEVSYLLSFTKASIILFASILYVSTFNIAGLSNKLINIFFLNGVFCFVVGSFPELLSLANLFKQGTPEIGFIPYRNAFLSGSGYFGIGAPYALMIAFSCYILASENQKVFNFIKFVIIAMAGIVAARTAFLGVFFGVLYLFFKKPTLSVFIFIAFMVCIAITFSLDFFSDYSSWVFEFFNSNSSDSKTGTESTDTLFTMYFIPKAWTIVFGDGQYANGDLYYMNTDAGYMRNILFGGVFFTSIVIIVPYLLSKISNSNFYFFVLFPLTLIMHIKGALIINNPTAMPVLILISAWFSIKNRVSAKLIIS